MLSNLPDASRHDHVLASAYNTVMVRHSSSPHFHVRKLAILNFWCRRGLCMLSKFLSFQNAEPAITSSADDEEFEGIGEFCLDYVWYDTHSLGALGALETPTREDILKHTSLPSPLFPSDHLPLKFKLYFL